MSDLYNHNVKTLYDAMDQSVKRIGIIQTNIANSHTVGFKSIHPDSVMFSDVMSDVFRDEEQGVLEKTNHKLDLALTKAGAYFMVEGPDGKPERTRDGQFHLNRDGKIVDIQDRELVVLDQQINKPEYAELAKGGNIKINQNGHIHVNGTFIGRIAIDYEAQPGEKVHVMQGSLETSNVDLSSNVTKILQVKRHIDTVQNVLSMQLGVDKALIETYGRNL
ncbi:MAG: hypothetical protein O3C63_01815 [Cyanobacteria bacterium]|nr:hypothetical protein [Cyanobacteriota bacterium]MDA1020404.1 hypothetical protein [Cyanobacteriota bacterium]